MDNFRREMETVRKNQMEILERWSNSNGNEERL